MIDKIKEMNAQKKIGKEMMEIIMEEHPNLDWNAFHEDFEKMPIRMLVDKYGIRSTIMRAKSSRKMKMKLQKAMKQNETK